MTSIDKILKVQGKYYEWNEKMEDLEGKCGFEYGVIAQEVQKEFPEMVKMDSDGYLTVDYIQFIPILIESIRELKIEIDSIKCQINKNQK